MPVFIWILVFFIVLTVGLVAARDLTAPHQPKWKRMTVGLTTGVVAVALASAAAVGIAAAQ